MTSLQKAQESFLENLKLDEVFNNPNGQLPWGLYNPKTDGNLTWNCGTDAEGKIISVFCMTLPNGEKEKKCDILPDMDEAKRFRKELENDGWQKLNPPKFVFTMPDEAGVQRPINRKQKRFLERKIKQGYDILSKDEK